MQFQNLPTGRWDVTLPSEIIEKDELLIENEKLNAKLAKLENIKEDSKDSSSGRWDIALDDSIKKDDLILENERLKKKIAELEKSK